jgi:hypothetical protein
MTGKLEFIGPARLRGDSDFERLVEKNNSG